MARWTTLRFPQKHLVLVRTKRLDETWQGSQGPAVVSLGGDSGRDGSIMYADSCLVMFKNAMSSLLPGGRLFHIIITCKYHDRDSLLTRTASTSQCKRPGVSPREVQYREFENETSKHDY